MLLLIGGDSEIGAATHRRLVHAGLSAAATTRRADRTAPGRPHLDLAQDISRWAPPKATESAVIFVALARLAACAADPAASSYINVTQTLTLIERLLAQNIHVLFLSTNQVFDGTAPHVRADAPLAPVSEYGRQKARVETVLLGHIERGAPGAVLRLSKVVSTDMALIHGWIDALRTQQTVRAFSDMMMAPAPTELVADVIARLMRDRATGVFQLSGPRDVSYLDVARYLADRLGTSRDLVESTTAADAGQPPGATPRHTTLDTTLIQERYGLAAPGPWDVIDAVIAAKSR
jgi:dTDP-4-dehydrorhamnose reductase